MKKSMTTMLAALSLIAGVGAKLAAASEIEGNVPFAFYMGSERMPAGHYRVNMSHGNGLITLRNTANRTAKVSVSSAASTKPGRVVLMFKKVDSVYFLDQVWDGGPSGSQLPRSKVQQELHARAVEIVTIAAARATK